MIPNEHFQRLLYDLFCMWHGVQRHYDPPLPESEEQRHSKVNTQICKLLGEIEGRVARIKQNVSNDKKSTDFYEEWTMLTWNVLCITSRLQSDNSQLELSVSNEDRPIYSRLNQALVELVNYARDYLPFSEEMNEQYESLKDKMNHTMHDLHQLYRTMNSCVFVSPEHSEAFRQQLAHFGENTLIPCVDQFKQYCNQHSMVLWRAVRGAQIEKMRTQTSALDGPVHDLVAFYSEMMYVLAVLGARLQGFRYDLVMNKKVFGSFDPVQYMSEYVFAALELLMSDCVLSTEPSTNAILVTNNLFPMECGALARGVVFRSFEIQVVSEETADQIQSEMSRQRLLQHPTPLTTAPSAALLAMKPTTGTKRSNAVSNADSANNTAHKKSDVNSKEYVTIYPEYNTKYRYWLATYPHLLCTTRQKGKQSTHNSFQDLSPSGMEAKSNGKRPIFYFHIKATMFSPSGRFATAHTLSLPFAIATRRNQDCQVQRMMSSYTATIFWVYGCNNQDGLLLQWVDSGMHWEHFKHLYKQHFKVNADVQRGLEDSDFDLLKYKLQCPDCIHGEGRRINGIQQVVTFKNVLCPHLRYECGSTNVRFSVWRGMLELLQIFHDARNNVRKLWEMNLLMGFLEFKDVDALLEPHKSCLIIRLSFVTGGTICFTCKSIVAHTVDGMAHSLDPKATRPIHLEPLDLKRLQTKCLKDYLRDIADAEKVKYILNAKNELVRIADVLRDLGEYQQPNGGIESRDISSNVTHSGDIDAMQHIRFTAMRIAVVTCKVKPPSADLMEEDEYEKPATIQRAASLLAPQDDFLRELVQLSNFYGKSRQELFEAIESLPEGTFHNRGHNSLSYSSSLLDSSPKENRRQLPSPNGNHVIHNPYETKFDYSNM